MAHSTHDSQSAVGKTVRKLITRQDDSGHTVVIMMQFTDGSCFEFVSPRSNRMLNRVPDIRTSSEDLAHQMTVPQMNLFSHA